MVITALMPSIRRHTRLVNDWSSDVTSSDLSSRRRHTRLGSDWSSDVCRLLLERSEEHTSELQSLTNLVCRLLLEKKKVPELDLPDLHPRPTQSGHARAGRERPSMREREV